MIAFLSAHWGQIATCLLVISETMALVPGLESNSILEAIISTLKKLVGK